MRVSVCGAAGDRMNCFWKGNYQVAKVTQWVRVRERASKRESERGRAREGERERESERERGRAREGERERARELQSAGNLIKAVPTQQSRQWSQETITATQSLLITMYFVLL